MRVHVARGKLLFELCHCHNAADDSGVISIAGAVNFRNVKAMNRYDQGIAQNKII